jgi:asparagine synthase (glutamine-hydrolysing)
VCGIAGWVEFDRDLRQERAAVRVMTSTMALRGPDAEGVWVDRHAGLGHRRLAVIDLVGGVQPMTVQQDGVAVAALTYSGEVYNFRELRCELSGYGHVFRTESDTEVVLHAYLQWGDAFVDRLNGMYAFGLWDARNERLLLVRDRMGIKPLYYFPTRHGVLFASEPKAILAHPGVRAVVRAEGLRELFTFSKTPGGSIYHGMSEVAAGHVVCVDRQGLRSSRYWGLTAVEHGDDLRTTVRTVRDLLDDIVTRQLIADVPLCTLLSGGLDSSALTAMAASVLGRSGDRVHSFAVDFVGQTERFRPDALRGTPDAPFVHQVAGHVLADHRDIVLDTAALTDPLHRAEVLAANDAPVAGDLFTSLYLLFRAVRDHSVVALSGESADEVFGGYAWFHDPAAVHADTFPWLAMFPSARGPSLPDGGTSAGGSVSPVGSILNPDLLKILDLQNYLRDSYRQALGEVEHLPGESPTERRMREVCYLHLTRFVQILLDRKDRMSMAHGLEVRVPFCDHRLVEYVYNVPWAMKTFDGREKSLLRAAVAELLPDPVLQRRKSPYPSTQDPAYLDALRTQVREVLADVSSPALDLLDRSQVDRLIAPGAPDGARPWQRMGAEVLLGLDRWLRSYPVRLDLAT